MQKTLLFRNKKINYTTTGKGKPIILLHGFLESLKMWDVFARELAKDFRVVCIDLPGFGKSDCVDEVHTMELMAEVVKEVLEREGIDRCIMVGHSMGGYVSLSFLEQFPEHLGGIVLFHSHGASDTEAAKENRERTIQIVERDRKGFINQFVSDLFAPQNVEKFHSEIEALKITSRKTPKEGIIAALNGMKYRTAKIELLANTLIPVLFILGKEDPRIPFATALAQAALPNYSSVLILGNVGHMGFVEARAQTLKALGSFAGNCFNVPT